MTTTSRRHFLRNAALAGGALVMPGGALLTTTSCARAPDPASSLKRRTDHYFVFYFLVGGWDLLMATDPLPPHPGIHLPYDESAIIETNGARVGPAMRPLLPYLDRAAILRGIFVDALNHPQARFRMVTGRFKEPGKVIPASVQTLIGKKYATQYELINVSGDALRPAVFRGPEDLKLDVLRGSSVEQLKNLANVSATTERNKARIAAALKSKDALFAASHADLELAQETTAFAELAREAGASDLPQRFRRGAGDMKAPPAGDRAAAQAIMAVECIKQDIAPIVTVGTGEFDSHTEAQYRGHPASVRRGFETIGKICRGLDDTVLDDGTTLLDKTTIVVTSEFSRTPDLNELGGKHHWPANSLLLLGKGVKRSREGAGPFVFGATDDGLFPLEINPETGSRKRGAELLDTTHGLATVLQIAGLDPRALLNQDPIHHLLA